MQTEVDEVVENRYVMAIAIMSGRLYVSLVNVICYCVW